MGGAVGCVVTGKKLYSHGNFIRDLDETEYKELKQYKKDLTAFKKKIEDAFANAEKLEQTNSTIPPMPLRPSMPAFCSKSDTILYIFGGCTVQNYKVYIANKFARDLSPKEKKQLDQFAKQVASKNAIPSPQIQGGSNNSTTPVSAATTTTTTFKPAMDQAAKVNLDFCTEF
uniref:Pepsin inhibitor-3-like repeated domain-containing protein n=1 Tax=Panagrolaimus superbus TaxID=310955 RepID=A0A914ZBF4_9BILA